MPSAAASSSAPNSAVTALTDHFRRMNALAEAMGGLHWDSSVMMPEGGAGERAEQLAVLSTLHHEMMTRPQVAEWLAAVDEETLTPWEQANIIEMRRAHAHATAVPGDLVEALSRACSESEQVWRKARPASDFAAVLPKFAEVLRLTREAAQAKSEALGVTPYDALLDQYEPDGSAAEIDMLFSDLESFLPDFLNRVLDAQGPEPAPLQGPFPRERQEALARRLMETVGFDFRHGRLDTSAHPFCGGTPQDVRITTRYDESDFMTAMMGVLHETGHGLYERGLPTDWAGQPVGKARGMSLHESQSLLMEMQACRSQAFFRFAAPLFRRTFGGEGPDWSDEAFYRRAIRVERGFIRVDADEVTYPLHVILRYRLERDMIEGRLEARDLRDAWNERFKALMGVAVPEDRVGCLQDIHWFDGAIGYFPTYTLGAMTAAQLYAAALKADPSIPDAIAAGDFGPLRDWLRPNVHAKASSLSTRALLREVTGSGLDAAYFKAHLKRRYMGEG